MYSLVYMLHTRSWPFILLVPFSPVFIYIQSAIGPGNSLTFYWIYILASHDLKNIIIEEKKRKKKNLINVPNGMFASSRCRVTCM